MKITLGDIVFGGSSTGGGCVASEETRTYTENSTYTITPTSGDCISKATVTVDVPSKEPALQSKTLDITSNGSYSLTPDEGIDGLSNADITVNVPTTTPATYVVPDGMNFGYSTLTEFPTEGLDFSQKTNFNYCWYNWTSLTEFPALDLSKGTSFNNAWYNCSSLTSFPKLNVSNGTDFQYAWRWCSKLKEFPALDLSKGTSFNYAWGYCSSLTEFPMLDLSKGTDFYGVWKSCSALTSIGRLDLSSGTDFSYAWDGCSSLTTLGGFGAISADIDLHWSTLLTVDSLMNIINQAATVTGKTMTLGSENLAKLSDEQKAVATNKGWTLA